MVQHETSFELVSTEILETMVKINLSVPSWGYNNLEICKLFPTILMKAEDFYFKMSSSEFGRLNVMSQVVEDLKILEPLIVGRFHEL